MIEAVNQISGIIALVVSLIALAYAVKVNRDFNDYFNNHW